MPCFQHLSIMPLGELRFARWALGAIAVMFFETGIAATPTVALQADPLFSTAAVDKPAMVLALSVEFPTVGAQYVKDPGQKYDDSYSNLKEYIGYYDAESCYVYNDDPSEVPETGKTKEDYKRFDRKGPAVKRQCEDEFSGNFLNWASSSAIDMLRLSLTGGDRYIDIAAKGNIGANNFTPALTVLQRAVIPNGDPVCMWGSSNFPLKQLVRGSDDSYFKAVPKNMRTEAKNNKGSVLWTNGDIWIANTLNQIYFGTDKSLGVGCLSGPPTFLLGSTSYLTMLVDNEFCAFEGGTCKFSEDRIVWYGALGQFNYKYFKKNQVVTCNNATFGDPIGVLKRCHSKKSSEILNGSGFFYSRVQVCNANEKGELQDNRDYALCTKYPNGSTKPTGAIQKYSNQLRLAAFGYLLDQDRDRYGGVLRAPMKYVGAKTFDVNGADSGANPRQEWNPSNGVLVNNPENSSEFSYSGVINYLNLFGRTGNSPGVYKKYDPIGELHYESLRYLQGLQPSAAAIKSINNDMKDGYPVITSWTDPYANRPKNGDYSCLKSNIVVIGDTNTWDNNKLPTANMSQNIPDINYWRELVKDFERNKATSYTDAAGNSRTSGNPNGSAASVPSRTDRSQIIGTAYWARTQDIRSSRWTAAGAEPRPGLRVKTFVFDVNEYGAQNDVTKRRTDQLFLAAKYGGFETDPSNLSKNPYNTWGNPFYQEDGRANNNVWQDTDTRASRLGEANTYFLQSDARGVLSAFDDIFRLASTASRSIAGGAMQGKNLAKDGGYIYQAAFDTADWSGDLLATAIKVDADNKVTLDSKPEWSAAARLGAISKPADVRNIVVGNTNKSNSVAAAFKWTSIEGALKTHLNATDNLGEARLKYLSGDNAKEGNPFRVRSKLLGDIINSGVVYSGAPTTSISSAGYAKFYSDNKARTAAVYAGANDGMLHAFDAKTGDELFAYIPSWLGSRLAALSSDGYATNHQSYVDSTPVVAEAEVSAGNWKTLLVSGTGGGGRGVFALDVTDPSKFAASNVLWEFTAEDDPDLGYVVGVPRILKIEKSTGVYQWYAVFGSGVNNSSGKPALFILDLSKSQEPWRLDTNYFKVMLPTVDSNVANDYPNGLINFQATIGLKKEVTYMYMGDLHGNVWKLTFKDIPATKWNINSLSAFNKGTFQKPAPYPFFTAKDAQGKIQPITVAPTITSGPKEATSFVFFGTGKYLERSDVSSTTQSAYLLYDNGLASADNKPAGTSAISGRGRLQIGSVNTTSGNVLVEPFTFGRPMDKDIDRKKPNPVASGWFFDFPNARERQITSASFLDNKLLFGTLIPTVSGAAGSCYSSGGTGKQYTLSLVGGNGLSEQSKVGILGETMTVEVVSARKYSPKDSTGKTIKSITTQTLQQGSDGVATHTSITSDTVAGRLSWRQIHDYQQVRNTSP